MKICRVFLPDNVSPLPPPLRCRCQEIGVDSSFHRTQVEARGEPALPMENGPILTYEIGAIRQMAIGAPNRIIHFIDEYRGGDGTTREAKMPYHAPCLMHALLEGLRLEQRMINPWLFITECCDDARGVFPPFLPSDHASTIPEPRSLVWGPGSIGMGLNNIYREDMNIVAIKGFQLLGGSDPLPIGVSGKGAKN